MTVDEFGMARKVAGQYLISVAKHKTAHCYGPANVCVSVMLYSWLKTYVAFFRSAVCFQTSSDRVFITWNGEPMSSGQVTRAVQAAWSKAGLGTDITCTLVRKTAVATVHQKHPQLKNTWLTYCVTVWKQQVKAIG